ncbi:MAG: O-antigen ligase family protein [Candidatus Woykebacteria bacterium]
MRFVQVLVSITVIALPAYVVRCKDLTWCSSSVPITLLEALILISFLAWILWKYTELKKGKISFQTLFERLKSPFFWPLVTFLGISTVSVLISPDLRAAAGVWKAYFLEPALLYIVVIDLSLQRREIKWLIYPLLFSGLWVSGLAISQSITGVDPFAPDSIEIGRVTGVYDNPNALGLFLGPLILIGFGLLLENIKQKPYLPRTFLANIFIVISLVLFTYSIFLSRSRGALIGLVISLLVSIALIFYQKFSTDFKRVARWFFYTLIGVFLATSVVGFIYVDRFVSEKPPSPRNSLYVRLCIWEATRDLVRDKVVTGVGLSGFPTVYPEAATCERQTFQYPHNIFLNFWTELGILGLLVFLWISFNYLKILVPHFNNFLAVGLFSVLIYTYIHGLVDVPYFKNDLSSGFWVFLALATWFYKTRSSKT